MKNYFAQLFNLFIIVALTSCSASKEDDNLSIKTPIQLYEQGGSYLRQDDYKAAIKEFEALERGYPASELAPQASVKKAYSFYLNDNFDDVLYTIEDFLKQYPTNPAVPYMYYLKALCYYDQMVDIGRDQHMTELAYQALKEVVTRFPDSQYAKDAKFKMDLALNQLAGKQMSIGFFYLGRKEPIAALNRFAGVVTNYNTSIFTPEALFRMVEVYYSLGVLEQAEKYAAVLKYNYPDSRWYQKAYDLLKLNKFELQTSIGKRIIGKIW